jgi:DNA polymerase III delta subunit
MKYKPEQLLTKKENLLYKKILVTGLDESLISYVTEFIVNYFKERKYFIDLSGDANPGMTGSLFSDKKVLFLLKDYSSKKIFLENFEDKNQSVLISCLNNTKISSIKSNFQKEKDALVVDCYPLDRVGKEVVIKSFVEKNNLQLSNDVYWYIVECFENNYVLLIRQLTSLSLLKSNISLIEDVEKSIPTQNKIELNKIFFHVFKDNKTLIKIFNQNIYSQTDFYILLNSLKLYLGIISNSSTKEDALSKFPRYLFKERDVFIKLFNHLNKKKLTKIYKNILRVERLVRKNSNLYFVIGLRFLMSTKSIITS